MATNLSTYLTATQRLLHDATGNFWSSGELTDYINSARNKTASVTGCLRYLDTAFSLSTGVESYAFSSLTQGANTVDILNVTVIYSNTRYPLRWMPWTEFTAYMRPWTTYQTLPAVWSKYGSNTFYIGPKPDQVYTTEIDTIQIPNTLVDNTTVEQLIYPFTDPPPYYAAYLAKKKEQSYGEAQDFLREFFRVTKEAVASSQLRRIRDVFNQAGP